MSNLELEELYKIYAPTGQKFFFRGGLILLACILLGIVYGYTFMEIPADLNESDANQFRIQLGFGFGLVFAIIPIILLSVSYIRACIKAKNRAASEFALKAASKIKT
jgi:hypothetical protein